MMEVKKCSICGKEFFLAQTHMYKVKNSRGFPKIQCSYTCYRKAGGKDGRYNPYTKT